MSVLVVGSLWGWGTGAGTPPGPYYPRGGWVLCPPHHGGPAGLIIHVPKGRRGPGPLSQGVGEKAVSPSVPGGGSCQPQFGGATSCPLHLASPPFHNIQQSPSGGCFLQHLFALQGVHPKEESTVGVFGSTFIFSVLGPSVGPQQRRGGSSGVRPPPAQGRGGGGRSVGHGGASPGYSLWEEGFWG